MAERFSAESLTSEAIRDALNRVLSSDAFVASRQQGRFLSYVIDETLAGRSDRLKEHALAVDVFGKGQDFDPRLDSIVRVEASRLRSKLRRYYQTEGSGDSIMIEIPKGRYVPVFHENREGTQEHKSRRGPSRFRSRGWDRGLLALLVIATTYLLVDRLILGGQRAAEENRATTTSNNLQTIAVLPFANRSLNEEDAVFVDGIHDDLLTRLARIRSWNVISRASVQQFRDTTRTVAEIGATLGATNIIQGSVQREADRVRVSVQLVEVDSDILVWADNFDRSLTSTNLFAIQSEVAESVAEALETSLSADERRRVSIVSTDNLEAYEFYFRGKLILAEGTAANLSADAREYFEQAIALDPDFAPPYAGLADSYFREMWFGTLGEDAIVDMERAVNRALELDDELGDAHAVLGNLRFRQNDFPAAEAAFSRAVELSPNSALTLYWYSRMLASLGRFDEALESAQRAALLDPESTVYETWTARSLTALGRFDEALMVYQEILDQNLNNSGASLGIAAIQWTALGRLDEAATWYARALAQDAQNPLAPGLSGLLFLDFGKVTLAQPLIERAMERGPDGIWSHWHTQLFHAYRGDDLASIRAGQSGLNVANWLRFEEPVLLLQILASTYVRTSRYADARALFVEYSPALLDGNEPVVDRSNYAMAIIAADLLIRTGEEDIANDLLTRALSVVPQVPRLGSYGSGIAEARIYALMGQRESALDSLKSSIDDGWRYLWWYWLEQDGALESLRDSPEFLDMVQEIRADIDDQFDTLRANGVVSNFQ